MNVKTGTTVATQYLTTLSIVLIVACTLFSAFIFGQDFFSAFLAFSIFLITVFVPFSTIFFRISCLILERCHKSLPTMGVIAIMTTIIVLELSIETLNIFGPSHHFLLHIFAILFLQVPTTIFLSWFPTRFNFPTISYPKTLSPRQCFFLNSYYVFVTIVFLLFFVVGLSFDLEFNEGAKGLGELGIIIFSMIFTIILGPINSLMLLLLYNLSSSIRTILNREIVIWIECLAVIFVILAALF